ncbi:MAG: hypothetical protein AUG10_05665 [Gemmatimonadetes bacterium 13_1_20CM_2_70_10]|nr:MAG: hypothetical protein AUG10_05665 [Gemmatimonadetes bacterium 13_1_20CM_2_70_10]
METVRLDREIHHTTAANGVVVLSERVAHVRSAAVGVWVRTASAHEPRPKMGVSHLLEHMVFKGTERRTAQQIALELEARGGSLDAYTSRDSTAFQARVLDADLPRAVDVLTDIVRRPVLRDHDLSLERNVVLEEISTVEDTPDDLVFELLASTLWPEHPYGFSIPGNCVIAAAGNLTHEGLLEELGQQGWLTGEAGRGKGGGAPPPLPPVPAAVRGLTSRHARDTAQTHIVIATDSVSFADRRKYALMVLSNILGGGMSSRLFQRIREELGLAYAVYSYASFYREIGVLGTYVGTQPAAAERATAAILEEYGRLAREGLRGEALAEAKRQTAGQLMLSLESPTARMYRLAGFALHGERYLSLDEMVATVEGLTEDEVGAVAAEFFAPGRQTTVWLGPEDRR